MFKKSGIGMRIWQQAWGSSTAYSSYADVWTTENFSQSNVNNWDTAYGWGNHADAGYLTNYSYTETDTLATVTSRGGSTGSLVVMYGKVTLGNNTSGTYNGNTNGLTLNSTAEIRSTGVQNPPALTWHYEGLATRHLLMTSTGIMNFVSPSNENSGVAVVQVNGNAVWHRGDFTSTNVSNWNTAYGWGNHAGLYLPLSGGTLSGNLNTTAAIAFRDGAGTYSNIIRAAGYPSEGYDSSQTYWMEYRAYGGHHFVLNVDGGIGSGENAMDDFVIWQGAIDGDKLFELTNGGNLTISGTFTEQSSKRFKENIKPLEPSLGKVEQLNPVTYNKIGVVEEEIGLIAEEVAELFPEVVTYNEEGQPQGIQYQRLSVILLKAVQELTERVNKLENK
jgi:hypothetical protein